MAYDPTAHTIKLPGRKSKDGAPSPPVDYLPVKERVRWFRDEHPDGMIESTIVEITENRAVFQVRVSTPKGAVAVATGTETRAGFFDFVEKAETVALGRALAVLGYGIAFADEFEQDKEAADPKTYEPGKANVVNEQREDAGLKHRRAQAERPIENCPENGTAEEVLAWFHGRVRTVPVPKNADVQKMSEALGRGLRAAGLKDEDRRDAYLWLTGESSGKDMAPAQLATLLSCVDVHKVPALARCAAALRAEKAGG